MNNEHETAHEELIPRVLPVTDIGTRDDTGLSGVPWRWTDVFIGLVPLLALRAVSRIEPIHRLPLSPQVVSTLSFILTMAGFAWMLGYPLWAASRRRPGRVIHWPTAPKLLWEAMLAVPTWFGILIVVLIIFVPLIVTETLEPPATDVLERATQQFPLGLSIILYVTAFTFGPLAEEVFFRGLLFNAFRQRMPVWIAAVVQGLIFGFMHAYSLSHSLAASLLGLLLAVVYVWRRTLLAPFFVHALQNFFVVIVTVTGLTAFAQGPMIGVVGEDSPDGFVVTEVVADGPAERAGLQAGDVITAINGKPVARLADLQRNLRMKMAGDTVRVTVVREGQVSEYDVELVRRPR